MTFPSWSVIRMVSRCRASGDRLPPGALSAVFPGFACATSSRRGHHLVVTSDKDGPDSVFERSWATRKSSFAAVLARPHLTAQRIAMAPKLASRDHRRRRLGPRRLVQAAISRDITVAEVTYSNSISVAGACVARILALVRNYLPSYRWIVDSWNIADCVERAYDLEGMQSARAAGRSRSGRREAPRFRREAALHRQAPPDEGRRDGGA